MVRYGTSCALIYGCSVEIRLVKGYPALDGLQLKRRVRAFTVVESLSSIESIVVVSWEAMAMEINEEEHMIII